MKWNNLKNLKCPKCSAFLTRAPFSNSASAYCSCGFKISGEKFNEIVGKLYKKEPTRDNFADLQNMDRKEISEDFSDSPALDY